MYSYGADWWFWSMVILITIAGAAAVASGISCLQHGFTIPPNDRSGHVCAKPRGTYQGDSLIVLAERDMHRDKPSNWRGRVGMYIEIGYACNDRFF